MKIIKTAERIKQAEEYDQMRDEALEHGVDWHNQRQRNNWSRSWSPNKEKGDYYGGRSKAPRMATSNQLSYIQKMLTWLGRSEEFEAYKKTYPTSSMASNTIDDLKMELDKRKAR